MTPLLLAFTTYACVLSPTPNALNPILCTDPVHHKVQIETPLPRRQTNGQDLSPTAAEQPRD